jgi:peptidoglycan/LPS O-acetylase OafA/YrhL
MFLVWPLAVVALLGLSMAVSYVLHLSIEKPALRLRDRLAA